jgi:hypothetical protein
LSFASAVLVVHLKVAFCGIFGKILIFSHILTSYTPQGDDQKNKRTDISLKNKREKTILFFKTFSARHPSGAPKFGVAKRRGFVAVEFQKRCDIEKQEIRKV